MLAHKFPIKESYIYILVNVLSFAFFSTLMFSVKVNNKIFELFFFVSILLLCGGYIKKLKLDIEEKTIFLSYVLFNFIAIISVYYNNFTSNHSINLQYGYLQGFFIFLFLRSYLPRLETIVYACFLGTAVAFLIAFYQFFILKVEVVGLINIWRVMFGYLIVLLGILSFLCANILKNKRVYLLSYSSLFLSFIASILNGSRGSWFGFFVLICFFVLFNKSKTKIILSRYWYAIILFIMLVVIVFLVTKQYNRIYMIYVDIYNYQAGLPLSSNSIGLRFDMWKEALWIFVHNPIIGIGVDSWSSYIGLKHNLIVSSAILAFPHPHNEYLFVLATTGGCGIIVFMFMMLIPFKIFGSSSNPIKFAAYVFQATFLIYMLSDCPLYNKPLYRLYIMCIMLLLALRKNEIKSKSYE